jgi:hypothetical protein
MSGAIVSATEVEISVGQLINLNISGLAKGVYALQVVVGTKISQQLVVKQ